MKKLLKIMITTVICTSVALGNFAPLSISHAEEVPIEVRNPGFEEANNDLSTIPGWSMENNSSTPATITNTISHTGLNSLHFKDESDKAGSRVFSDRVSVIPGKSYTAKVMTNVVKQTHNIVYEVHYYDKDNRKLHNNIKTELFGNLPKNKWTELKVFTQVPVNAAYARLAFYSGVISLTEAYFDEVTWDQAVEDIPLEREYASPIDLGEMVNVQLGQAAAIQKNSLGENEVYYHSNGLPGTFSVLNAETGELKFSRVIEGTEALWAITVGSDQNVYFAGTGDGKLYRYLPEEKKIEELGVNPSDDWVWDLEGTTDGKIYGSTYPHADVFEYDIESGVFRNFGSTKEGQQYARGIGVDDESIYVGVGTKKHLIKIDKLTGEKEEIIIDGHSGLDGMIENIFIVNDKLFVSAGSVTMLVLDIETHEVINQFSYSNMISEPSPHNNNLIYFKFEKKLYQYDFNKNETKEIEGIPLLPDTVRVKDMEWITLDNGEIVLAMITQYGEYMLYEPVKNEMTFIDMDIASQSVEIQALEAGQDGKLYMGGYQRGLSIYNPFTNGREVNIPSFAQPEGIGFLNDKVYYGTYVGAMMYSYDPSKDIDLNSNPKLEYDITDHQDRPFTMTSGDNKLFVGTVPDYGVLGGVLAIFDENTGKWSQNRNVVEDQSIIGLAYKDGKLYGSTSIWGGLGLDPKAKEAKIFVWDVATSQKIAEFTPTIPGIDETPRMIGEISIGPDGNLWGIVDGTIFAIDPETLEVVKSKTIHPSLYNSSKWLPYRLEWAPDGMLYTTLSRKLVAIDPETLAHKVIVDRFINNMAVGMNGSIYYALGNKLQMIAVPETDATLKSILIGGKAISDFSPGKSRYGLPELERSSIQAMANQTEAKVNIIDEGRVSTIAVIATDGKSKKVYSIYWEQQAEHPEYAMDVSVKFQDETGKEIHKLTKEKKITAAVEVVNIRNKNQDVLVLMELIDENGKVVDQDQSSRTIPKGKTMKMSTKLKLPKNIKGYQVKVTAWEGKKIKENMVPLSEEFIIKE